MRLPVYQANIDDRKLTRSCGNSYLYVQDPGQLKLSASAVLLCELCSDGRTIREIVELIALRFPEYDKRAILEDVASGLADLVNAGLIDEQVAETPEHDSPLLITGCPRSGTTALARLLSTHPKFCIFNEYRLFNVGKQTNSVWKLISNLDRNQPPLKVAKNARSLKTRLLEELPIPVSDEAARNWLLGGPEQSGLVYGDKMPIAYLRDMERIIKRFPGARFLVTLRDGRAVVASQIRGYEKRNNRGEKPEHWMRASVDEAQDLWLKQALMWEKIRRNPPAPCLEVRYEEAVNDPESTARSVCEFVGVQYRPAEFEQFFERYRPVHTDAWRQEVPDIEDRLSEEFIETLRLFGYE